MLYIRTGDKVTQPFTIPLWAKILAGALACYFFWITGEYVKMVYILPEIARLEDVVTDKYELIDHVESLTLAIDKNNATADLLIETIEKDLAE